MEELIDHTTYDDSKRLLAHIGAEGRQALSEIIKGDHVAGYQALPDFYPEDKYGEENISREEKNKLKRKWQAEYRQLPEQEQLLHRALSRVFPEQLDMERLLEETPHAVINEVSAKLLEFKKIFDQNAYDDANAHILRLCTAGEGKVNVAAKESLNTDRKDITEIELDGKIRIPVSELLEFMRAKQPPRAASASPVSKIGRILEEGPQRRGGNALGGN